MGFLLVRQIKAYGSALLASDTTPCGSSACRIGTKDCASEICVHRSRCTQECKSLLRDMFNIC